MTTPLPEIVCEGPVRTVRFLVLPDGTSPARDFLESLRMNRKTKAKAAAVIRTAGRLAQEHHLPGKIWRKFDDTFHEIVCTGCRMLTVSCRRDLLLVHGFLKKENQAPNREISKARRALAKFMESPR